MTHTNSLSFHPIQGLPEVHAGDQLLPLLEAGLLSSQLQLEDGDVLVLAQKIVSKAEGRAVDLASVTPGAEARRLAAICHKDPRLVELILQESSAVLRTVAGVLIVRHRLGFTLANAGIDQSNLPGGGERVLLLPEDPDASAAALSQQISEHLGKRVAVLIADSFGRPWRMGVCGTCIGCAGLSALFDMRGATDREGRILGVTQLAVGDQLCATATLVCGEAAESTPAVLIRGVSERFLTNSRPATELVRPAAEDLFS
ncbi:coenzyme F420-0:L-glutamate ligase [Pseudomaricurvus sp. HS19]|uniref:coenzyme F420-0:L-glutamate ligase n=1 Tax=Pseudomaricurvus sp. HS19 TaxID=2692626 RepID=UPI00136EC68D|nr:coenzyme F420-0:L-glutamate ligase [Pseudomaricurvus sp. HS19]MYM64019.1 coenzyme F420-0:L-glutamate ligase [Pseudomaricurvus sp. HS19]